MFDAPLLTRRLRLRPLEVGDLTAVHSILGDPTTTADVSFGQPDAQSTAAWIARRRAAQQDRGVSMWAVELIESSEVVGLCGFFAHDRPELELGYVIRADRWGEGLATEAVAAMLAEADAAGVPAFAIVRSTNAASLAVARRAGFVEVEAIEDDRGRRLVLERPLGRPGTSGRLEATS